MLRSGFPKRKSFAEEYAPYGSSMQTLRNQPVQNTYAAFHFVSPSRKKFQAVKLGASSCVLHAGNVISSRYPHVTSFVGDSRQPRIPTLSRLRTYVCTTYTRRVRSRFIHVRSCTNSRARALVHTHTHTQCISRSLWLGAIRKLYSKRLAFNPPGKPDAGEARWNVGAHITGAFSMPVSTRLIRKIGKQIRARVHARDGTGRKFGFQIAPWPRAPMLRKFVIVNDDVYSGLVYRHFWDATIARRWIASVLTSLRRIIRLHLSGASLKVGWRKEKMITRRNDDGHCLANTRLRSFLL